MILSDKMETELTMKKIATSKNFKLIKAERADFLFLFTIFLLIIFSTNFVLAQEVCCEKTTSGAWCQLEQQSNCAPGYSSAPTSCEQTVFCQKGTCVDGNTGSCSSNTPKGICESQGGNWYNKDKDEIPECRAGCCILGQEVAFVNQATCKSLATDYGVPVNFRADITSQAACYALDTTTAEGACVISGSNGETNCKRTTASQCSNLKGTFNKGLLCTAAGLSDCAKDSTKTKIFKDKVYFSDTCGNIANIYDESRFNDAAYWEKIQNPTCSVGSLPSSTCGECSYRLGTIGAEYKANDPSMPKSPPEYGNNVCKELSCYYDTDNDGKTDSKTEKYKHGESWCAQSEGTYYNVPFEIDGKTKKVVADGYNQYNLPGSRYYKLKCYDGEVLIEPCADFRNEICQSAINPETEKSIASCVLNEGNACMTYATRTDCEARSGCKWIPGYNVAFGVIDLELEGPKLSEYYEKQGVCLPLFAPGSPFWNSDGEELCSKVSSSIAPGVIYEVGTLGDREELAGKDIQKASEKCLDNCFAIPGYGKGNTEEELANFHLASSSPKNEEFLSKREGYYCKKDSAKPDEIDNTKTGGERSEKVNCVSDGKGEDKDKRRIKPYYTHEGFLRGISERSRSVGDCGYKPSAFSDKIFTEDGPKSGTGWKGDPLSEKITAIFQILKQDQDVKKLVGERKTIYDGPAIDARRPFPGYRNSEEVF